MKRSNLLKNIALFHFGAVAMFFVEELRQPVGSYSEAMSILSEHGTTMIKDSQLYYTSQSETLLYYEIHSLAKLHDVYDSINITNYEALEVEQQLYECENQIKPIP